jgi:hypothetical protein
MRLHFIKPLFTFQLIAMIIIGGNVYAGNKIIKWVDPNGVTHYGDKPPAPGTARKSSELNKYGVTIEETASGSEKKLSESIVEEQSTEEQQRYDHSLLSTFSSVEEIEIARKRNIKIDELALAALQQKQSTLKARVGENKQSNSGELSVLQNLELQIQLKKESVAKTNQRYEKDKLRYLELTSKKK